MQGPAVFQAHCASCHGTKAEGATEWRMTDADGNYPPPPLNGRARAWHHLLSVLEQPIAEGGMPEGSVIPSFAEKLSAEEAQFDIPWGVFRCE